MIRRVRLNKEYFILEKDGVPVAGIMDIDEFEDYLELRNPKIRAHIRESYRQYLAAKAGRRIDSSLRSPRARGEATNTGHAGGPDRAVLRPNHATLRLRSGRWRFRYDILGQEIVLHYCGLRREDTYD